MHSLPQEIEVWYVIPAIRRELARILTKDYKLSYDKTASILGVTKPAITHYNSNKRAAKIKLRKEVISEIEKSAKRINKEPKLMTKEIMRILDFMRKNRISFEVCKSGFDNLESCKEIRAAYEHYWNC